MNGLFMEGARWDTQGGVIMDSRLKELFPPLPVLNIKVYTNIMPCEPNKKIVFRLSRKISKICATCTNALFTRRACEDPPTFGLLISRLRTSHQSGRWLELHFYFKYNSTTVCNSHCVPNEKKIDNIYVRCLFFHSALLFNFSHKRMKIIPA